jgi:hypothetical protein
MNWIQFNELKKVVRTVTIVLRGDIYEQNSRFLKKLQFPVKRILLHGVTLLLFKISYSSRVLTFNLLIHKNYSK